MKTATILLLAALVVLVQARRVKKYPAHSHNELQKEADNKIHHGPVYKKALSDEEFARKKARYYKKLRLGHRGEHRPGTTKMISLFRTSLLVLRSNWPAAITRKLTLTR